MSVDYGHLFESYLNNQVYWPVQHILPLLVMAFGL